MKAVGEPPKVSVCVVTYNQEKYIRQCLQSIIDQDTGFDFEVIVGDDCSTDGTRAIVQEFAARHPSRFVTAFHTRNLGAVGNYFATHELARGAYIAHIDGDDYILPGKLQRQSDFLDAHPDHNVVWHRVRYEFADGRQVDDLIDYEKIRSGYTRDDLIRYTFVANHSSKLYRASQRQFCRRVENTLDYFLNLDHLQHGKAAYVGPEILGVYRYGQGISTAPSLKYRHFLLDRLLQMAGEDRRDHHALNFAAFVLLVSDVRSSNNTWAKSCKLFANTFSLSALFEYPHGLRLRKIYSTPFHAA